jgi:hypothetical protein
MNIAKYTFISPYPNPVQVGRLDPSSVEKDESQKPKETQNIPAFGEKEQKLKEAMLIAKRDDANLMASTAFSLDTYA